MNDSNLSVPTLVSPKTTAAILDISIRSLWRIVSTGELKPVRLTGRIVRFKAMDIQSFIDAKAGITHAS